METKNAIHAAVATTGDVVDPSTAAVASSVILRGVSVALDSDVGQAFVVDCARHTEGLVPDSDIKSKWGLTEEGWTELEANRPLLDAVRTERERRIRNGDAAREAAQLHFSKAPHVLGDLLKNEQVAPRHRIEAARELRQAAGDGSDATPRDGEKFTIHINLGTKQLHYEETIGPPKPSFADDGEPS